MMRWLGIAAFLLVAWGTATWAGLQGTEPAEHEFPAPPLPVDEMELTQHCIAVTARQMQTARLQLQKRDLNPRLRATYEQRRESARAFAAVLGLIGGKGGALEEYRTGRVARDFALLRPDVSGVELTPAERETPNPNEERLWEREQWCETHLIDPLSRGSDVSRPAAGP